MAQTSSVRQQQRQLVAQLRAEQWTWPAIASEFRRRSRVSVRAALRMVHGWSQSDAAERWNRRWPEDPKTFKNFSYWELWPSPTGHAPSLDVLTKLAELYECSVADLVADCADFRDSDSAYRHDRQLAVLSSAIQPPDDDIETSDSSTPPHVTKLLELISQLELVDVRELARLTSSWAARLGIDNDPRALLLKLSAGLSLAANLPHLGRTDDPQPPDRAEATKRWSGVWHSRYVYPSTGRNSEFTGHHYIVVHQQGDRLTGQSLPHSTGSQLRLDLAVDVPLVTGTWRETTSPTGYYRGATYHGTLQLVMEPSGQRMQGMWLGFGRDFTVNSGEWGLTREESSTTKQAQRPYHFLA